MKDLIVLSRRQVQPLLAARRVGAATALASLDLGLTSAEVALTPAGVALPDGETLSWQSIGGIAADDAACFVVRDGAAEKIHVFSKMLQRPYSLMATAGAPTIVNSGFTMHRIVGIDPYQDTLRKVRAIAPMRGDVLDTVTGLGYTAIEAARTARRVLTIELDPAVLEVARLNPWSRALFDDPRIHQVVGDAGEAVHAFADQSFDRILHDPPVFALAGDLYSGAFYAELARILRRKGRLFHYIGDPASASGRRVTAGVVRRLREAGFARVVPHPEAFGVTAFK